MIFSKCFPQKAADTYLQSIFSSSASVKNSIWSTVMLKKVNARHILRCTKGRVRDLRSYNHTELNNSSSEESRVKKYS